MLLKMHNKSLTVPRVLRNSHRVLKVSQYALVGIASTGTSLLDASIS